MTSTLGTEFSMLGQMELGDGAEPGPPPHIYFTGQLGTIFSVLEGIELGQP